MSEYAAVPSNSVGGKLKLKGVTDSRIDKKKKKKKLKSEQQQQPSTTKSSNDGSQDRDGFAVQDNSVVLESLLEDEDNQITKESRRKMGVVDGKQIEAGDGAEDEVVGLRLKTEAERRYDEQRRRRLEERLKREGVKTHKERVEELNRYLSSLSEHHDMPKIGPG